MTPFDQWWATEGIRFLAPENKIPSIQQRCQAAYEAGREDQKQEFDLPPGIPLPEVEIINEEERE
jgi:hypothetical protein